LQLSESEGEHELLVHCVWFTSHFASAELCFIALDGSLGDIEQLVVESIDGNRRKAR
jgi:hypothetical protein